MIDESTDRGGSQNLIIYIRGEIDGDSVSFFWGLVKLRKTTSAADITDALLDDLNASQSNNWLGLKRDYMVRKWAGFATDGASAKTGLNGVANRLAEQFPLIVSIHCVAHRLQLTVVDTVKKTSSLIKFEDAFRDIYSYYSRFRREDYRVFDIHDTLEEFVKVLGSWEHNESPSIPALKDKLKFQHDLVFVQERPETIGTPVKHSGPSSKQSLQQNASQSTTKNAIPMHNILCGRHIVFEEEDSELEQLFVVASVLPVSTAICERGFSIQNVIKTVRRTRLNERRLDALMRIAINEPPSGEMDQKIIMSWVRSGNFPSEWNPPQASAADSEDLEEIDWQQILTRCPDSMHYSNIIRDEREAGSEHHPDHQT
ncbi:hypothetical protein RvY_12393 [Ramazzottius varieornatus]|uniref:HAT C-terminal dimerisation domain-containing protein n=1 Tax=Ramazzottius varieornatus TaxID=947166 RepID=A0A1D1VNK5_RAMVA|nr:hypothetical protein RvY_12393 [Ramazzottius varieornatus]